jgi:hypothetical protein
MPALAEAHRAPPRARPARSSPCYSSSCPSPCSHWWRAPALALVELVANASSSLAPALVGTRPGGLCQAYPELAHANLVLTMVRLVAPALAEARRGGLCRTCPELARTRPALARTRPALTLVQLVAPAPGRTSPQTPQARSCPPHTLLGGACCSCLSLP